MADKKFYIDTDVYTEAKKRIRKIINAFDSVLVSFSGGKDSLTALNLVQEVYDEMGIKEKVKVIFRDEELIPDDVIDFVQSIYESGKFDFRYYAIPLRSDKFVLGKTEQYVQWDKGRKWLRQPPAYAITMPAEEYRIFDQYTADTFICKNEKGRVALISGIRADESLVRFSSCCIKKNENFICATKDPRVHLCKPIFDWTEKDIFLYFFKKKIRYCVIYDLETINGDNLRVSTPLHSESAKRFHKLKTLYPNYYQQLIDIFPEMKVQSMYYASMDLKGTYEGYEHSFAGLLQFLDDTISDPVIKGKMEARLQHVWATRKTKIAQGSSNFGGYPLLYLFDAVSKGNYKREIMAKAKPTKRDLDFEMC